MAGQLGCGAVARFLVGHHVEEAVARQQEERVVRLEVDGAAFRLGHYLRTVADAQAHRHSKGVGVREDKVGSCKQKYDYQHEDSCAVPPLLLLIILRNLH